MGNSNINAALQMELGHAPSGMNTDSFNEKRGHIRKLLTTLEAHQSVENGINSNESLSQAGKLAALKKLGNETTAPALKWMKNVIEEMQQKDRRYRTQFYTITSGIDDTVERLLTFTYMWHRLDTLDPNERIKQFLMAAEANQVVVLSAMLVHPFSQMVSEEVKERALTERAKRLTPNDYNNHQQNQLLLEFMVTYRDWLGRWLREEVAVDIAVLRTALGDEVADTLKHQAPELVSQ